MSELSRRTAPEAVGPPVDPQDFRTAVSGVAGHVAVASTTLRRMDHAITVTSYTWVSLDPPLLLVCVHEDARFLDAVLETGTWGLSVLGEGGRRAAEWLATPGRPVVDQLARVPHSRGPATGAPLVDGALLAFECRTTATHPGGDHVVVVGEVVGITRPAVPADAPGGVPAGAAPPGPTPPGPLVRYLSEYRRLA
ncbi:flavin reductase family protein [Quadrisphaera sp. DSM 44207]|uniref:flavin reductase family protein n=1 Tax=Quadrisphaera sp. DSM 44207 TaxID=1881057 RepID=UPI00088A093C|nr:flavin reductase family protein [Quadrisphaera sp. DSM 44207]SDQ71048.1 NADH-FMN oxidoreductase RutF, flavin reductase (DIM6/NTAB) family [Quadrisphaera sp. DSM 44207]